MAKAKFKVGDKVRLLPSAVNGCIDVEEVGKTGIIKMCDWPESMIVYMDKPLKRFDYRIEWVVQSSMIEPYAQIEEQLLFNFMEEEDY